MAVNKNGSNFDFLSPTYHSTTSDIFQEQSKCSIELYEGSANIVINLILILVGTCGNALIIFAVLKTPSLRQRSSSFLLLSLAVADLIATMCAQTFHVANLCFNTYGHFCVPEVGFGFFVTGNFSIFCSMFHLSAISIDRALATLKPHKYTEMMKKRGLKMMLAACWGSAVVFVSVQTPFFEEGRILSTALIIMNYLIIITAYIAVISRITLNKFKPNSVASCSTNNSRSVQIEKRVSITILIVISYFSICALSGLWLFIDLRNTKIKDIVLTEAYMWIITLALSNSSANFVIYSFRMKQFRTVFGRILRNILPKPLHILLNSQTNNLPANQPGRKQTSQATSQASNQTTSQASKQ